MPNVVKGSKQEKMVVVPHRPARRLLFGLLVVLLGVGGSAGGYWLGVYSASQARVQSGVLAQQLVGLEAENAGFRQQVALLERSAVMDRQAYDEIQATLTGLREYITSLEQDVQYYRQVMTSEFENVGLIVGQMDLTQTDTPRRYHFKLVMRQEESDGEYLAGHVNVDVVGTRSGQREVYPLRDLTDSEDQLDIKLRFRYFQNIEGDLELPVDFEPEQIEINAVATAPMAKSISKSYSWIVEGE